MTQGPGGDQLQIGKTIREKVQRMINEGHWPFPDSGERLEVVYSQCMIGIARHVDGELMFLTTLDTETQVAMAVREPMPKEIIYPVSFSLLRGLVVRGESPESIERVPDKPHEVLNPIYVMLLNKAEQFRQISKRLSTEEITVDLFDMGKLSFTVVKVRECDRLQLSLPRF